MFPRHLKNILPLPKPVFLLASERMTAHLCALLLLFPGGKLRGFGAKWKA